MYFQKGNIMRTNDLGLPAAERDRERDILFVNSTNKFMILHFFER
jgi:hypothetical protein